MRRPLTEEEKRYIVRRKEAGATLAEIAKELQCSIWTVQKWWQRHRRHERPRRRGRPRKGALSTFPEEVRAEAKRLKESHPHWGPVMVQVVLREQLGPEIRLPGKSQLARYFQEVCPEAIQHRQRQQYPEKAPPSARYPHERWQIDAQEGIPFGEGAKATVLNIRDPMAALMIASCAFETTTPKRWRKLTLAEIQQCLRRAFTEWGMPESIQTDREVVYAGHPGQPFPSLFTLWLVGLGIRHVFSRSHRPTDQGAEERNHRTISDMALKDQTFPDIETMQQTLDLARYRYNHHYPAQAGSCQGEPPLVKHPHARHSGRPFHPDAEWELFHQEWVDAYLAQQSWTRLANEHGQVSVGNTLYSLGKAYAGQTITVRFHPPNRHFRFFTADGQYIKELPAQKLGKVDIIGYMPVSLQSKHQIQRSLPFQPAW